MRVSNKAQSRGPRSLTGPIPVTVDPLRPLFRLPQSDNCHKDRAPTVNKAIIVSRYVGRRYPTTNQKNTKMIVIMMLMIIVIIINIINIIMSMGLPNIPSRSKNAGGNHPTHTTPQGGKGEPPKPTPEPHHTTGRGEATHTTPQGGGEGGQPHHTTGKTIRGSFVLLSPPPPPPAMASPPKPPPPQIQGPEASRPKGLPLHGGGKAEGYPVPQGGGGGAGRIHHDIHYFLKSRVHDRYHGGVKGGERMERRLGRRACTERERHTYTDTWCVCVCCVCVCLRAKGKTILFHRGRGGGRVLLPPWPARWGEGMPQKQRDILFHRAKPQEGYPVPQGGVGENTP